jgi:YebC/PmpR family DNA-binding regulatory protein
MSGHSKWSSIKHQKGTTDQRRSNLFTKISNMISVAARSGGDPTMNFQLRLSIDKARSANMPKDKIDRAIKRGTGELGGAQIEEILYEIYGPSGTAILVEAATDNKNRASAEIKSALNKYGGKLAGSGAVAFLFDRKGEIRIESRELGIENGKNTEEVAEETIINSGAEDYRKIGNGFLVYCAPESLSSVKNSLHDGGLQIESAELVWHPKTTVDLSDEESQKVIKLLEALDGLDDVVSVNSNLG